MAGGLHEKMKQLLEERNAGIFWWKIHRNNIRTVLAEWTNGDRIGLVERIMNSLNH